MQRVLEDVMESKQIAWIRYIRHELYSIIMEVSTNVWVSQWMYIELFFSTECSIFQWYGVTVIILWKASGFWGLWVFAVHVYMEMLHLKWLLLSSNAVAFVHFKCVYKGSIYFSGTLLFLVFMVFIASVGAGNLKARFENMAKASDEENRKKAEEERARRLAREKREREEAQRKQEVHICLNTHTYV